MSANNMYFAELIDDKWYGWITNAEESMADKESRKLHLVHAESADTLEELERKLNEKWDYTEYGLTTEPQLVKDGFPIEVVA